MMNIPSFIFFSFFFFTALGFFLIPQRFRTIYLLLASWVFYAFCSFAALPLLILLCFIVWRLGLGISRVRTSSTKKWLVALGGFCSLGSLLAIKYSGFMFRGLRWFGRLLQLPFNSSFVPDWIVPVGISFFTLKAFSYIMDVYRGKVKAEGSFSKIALYISFFPNILSGPIDKAGNFLPQLTRNFRFSLDRAKRGVFLILWGLFLKMVIADRLAVFISAVFDNPDVFRHSGIIGIAASFLFWFQLYCDFSGYSVLAVGVAQVLGFDLPDNFVRPYFSKNVTEFWRRWHCTLMTWLRDYVYIPLGGNRVGVVRGALNTLIVFTISGLWHGADAHFVLWGFLNGVFLLISRFIEIKGGIFPNPFRKTFGFRLTTTFLTVCAVSFAGFFFRAASIEAAFAVIKGLFVFNPEVILNGTLLQYGLNRTDFEILLLSVSILGLVSWYQRTGKSLRDAVEQQPFWIRWILILGLILFILSAGMYGPDFAASQFIYAQF